MQAHVSSPLNDALSRIAQQNGFTAEAAGAMLDALVRGGGGMAQFTHPEFGGAGQWMRGGMTLVPDMANHALTARVDALGRDISDWLASQPPVPPGAAAVAPASSQSQAQSSGIPGGITLGAWWPKEFGAPSSTGAQNGARYAYFADARRLAVDSGGRITVYDTLGHAISGFSQQQGGRDGMAFASQHGSVDLASLPVAADASVRVITAAPVPAPAAAAERPQAAAGHDELIATIEKLAALHERGILSAEEFAAKKAELLGRI
ncbi:MAG: SHOCT domain-containing protein [Pseudomonadota bacterium]